MTSVPQPPFAECGPAVISERLVSAAITRFGEGQLGLIASIAVEDVGVLTGEKVDVSVMVGSGSSEATLPILKKPLPDDPLPCVGLRGFTAVARYTFDNPQNLKPRKITVRVERESHTFDVPDFDVRRPAQYSKPQR